MGAVGFGAVKPHLKGSTGVSCGPLVYRLAALRYVLKIKRIIVESLLVYLKVYVSYTYLCHGAANGGS